LFFSETQCTYIALGALAIVLHKSTFYLLTYFKYVAFGNYDSDWLSVWTDTADSVSSVTEVTTCVMFSLI